MRSVALVFVGVLSSVVFAEQYWQVRSGTMSLTMFENRLASFGVAVRNYRPTAKPTDLMDEAVGFRVLPDSNLSFVVNRGAFRYWLPGDVLASGGFTLVAGARRVVFDGLTFFYEQRGTEEDLFVGARNGGVRYAFEVHYPVINFNVMESRMVVALADLHITEDLAKALGKPELKGQLAGMVTLEGNAAWIGGQQDKSNQSPSGGGGDNLDCELFSLSSLTMVARVGTYPNGENGLAMSTTACNRGTVNIPWYAPMDERHPTIAMNLYRERNGVLEQIGFSWMKHGFLSTNSNGCGTCQNPGTGTLLGVNCSDTYGVGNNSDRNYLGPREEVNPFIGRWTCRGSHFAGGQPDCVRRHGGSGHGPIDHMLRVLDSDLNVSGARFFYEAYYVVEGDVDKYNNIAWREATATWTGSSWSFNTITNRTVGPVINSWGDMRAFAQPRSQGDVIVAVKVTSLGGGMYHYEYAVYVHDFWQEIRGFYVPIPDGATVTNVGFYGPRSESRGDPVPQWSSAVGDGFVTWNTATFAQNPNTNTLAYGRMYNFRFDANFAPVTSKALLGAFKPGPIAVLTAGVSTPPGPSVAETLTVFRGLAIGGDITSTYFNDDTRFRVQPHVVLNQAEAPVQLIGETTVPLSNPGQLRVTLEAGVNVNNIVQEIQLYNFTTGSYETVDTRPASVGDSVVNVVITSNPARFIESGTNRVRARLLWRSQGLVLFYPWEVGVDRFGVTTLP